MCMVILHTWQGPSKIMEPSDMTAIFVQLCALYDNCTVMKSLNSPVLKSMAISNGT